MFAGAMVRYGWTRWQHRTACTEFIISVSRSFQIQRAPFHVQAVRKYHVSRELSKRGGDSFEKFLHVSRHHTRLITISSSFAFLFYLFSHRSCSIFALPFRDRHAVLALNEKKKEKKRRGKKKGHFQLLQMNVRGDASCIHTCLTR